MKERMIEITCPHCGHVFQIKRDTLAIAGISETIEKRLLEGSYFMHQCNVCHQVFTMHHPFLFRDPIKKYVLVLSEKEHIDNLPEDEMIIHCRSAEQLTFAYKVLSQGLNLSFMLQKKRQWERRWGEHVYFESYDFAHHCLWIRLNQEYKAILLTKEEEKKLTS